MSLPKTTENSPLLYNKASDEYIVKPEKSTARLYWELARMHKFPAGTATLVAPCLWAITMAAYRHNVYTPVQLLQAAALWFVVGLLRHCEACIWNDICDRDVDRLVERSKYRPLAAGTVSLRGAYILFFSLSFACIGMLFLAGLQAFELGLFGLVVFDMLYPYMKRWTYWPQAWLGVALAWAIPVAWLSATGTIDIPVVGALFLGCTFWTIQYDTIYGCQDRREDIEAGVKSTSLLAGKHVGLFCSVFGTGFVACLAAAGIFNHQGPCYFVVTVAGTAVHLLWQLYGLDYDDTAECWKKFASNGLLGYIIWAGMLGDYLLKIYL